MKAKKQEKVFAEYVGYGFVNHGKKKAQKEPCGVKNCVCKE